MREESERRIQRIIRRIGHLLAPADAAVKTGSIVCGTVFLLCLLALPVIDYVGGRLCMPLAVPPFWPAEIVPVGIGFLTAIILSGMVLASLVARRQRKWTVGALTFVVAVTAVFLLCGPHLLGFLHGLRDRFVSKVGYPTMRAFAREVSEEDFQADPDGIIFRPHEPHPEFQERQKRWDDLVSRYPFLAWTRGSGTVFVRDGAVELTWGSPLTGHWGFQVSPTGTVADLDEEDGRMLRVADDIQFVYYYD